MSDGRHWALWITQGMFPALVAFTRGKVWLKINNKHKWVIMWSLEGRHRASLVAQRLKRPPAMRKTWVWSLGQEDPLEKEMATHSSILAWRIPWTEEPGGLQSMGLQRVRHDWANSLSCYGKKMKSRGIAITSWQIDGETVETVTDFILGGSKITTDGDGSHKIKRRLLLGRRVMTNIESILKSRDIPLSTKVYLVSYAFPSSHVWMWELD